MKKILLCFVISIIFTGINTINAKALNGTIFQNDFSSDDGWHIVGTDAVSISGGQFNMNNAFCGYYNKAYHSINNTLPEKSWEASTEFSIVNPNPYGFGTGVVVMALTAGPLDFMSYDSTLEYDETYQDGLAVMLLSDGSTDNDINNWYFMIEAKKGNIRKFDLNTVIHANKTVSKYYIKLERLEYDLTSLSIFTDAEFLHQLPGSPVTLSIDPNISRLNTIQHGTVTPGYYTRLINASIDNDNVRKLLNFDGISYFDNPAGNGIRVFPNPGTSVISILHPTIDTNASGSFSIFNSSGAEILSSFMIKSDPINVSSLTEGLYFIIVRMSEKIYMAKFQKRDP